MTGPEFAELIRAATLASIRRTEARSPAAAAYARRELDEITQAAALGTLERIERGEPGDLPQLAARAANAAIIREWRHASDPRKTPLERETEEGKVIYTPDLQKPADGRGEPERAAEAADILRDVAGRMPPAYREDARRVITWTAAGYTAEEIAGALGGSSRRVKRILKAARDAAREMSL